MKLRIELLSEWPRGDVLWRSIVWRVVRRRWFRQPEFIDVVFDISPHQGDSCYAFTTTGVRVPDRIEARARKLAVKLLLDGEPLWKPLPQLPEAKVVS